MKGEIVLLHLSDLHMSADSYADIELRVKALLKDIEQLQMNPTLLLFSGDATYGGKEEEFALAHKTLFDPAKRRLHMALKKMMLVPGNHDVDRREIDYVREQGLLLAVTDTQKAQAHFDRPADKRLSAYYDYTQTYFNRKQRPFGTSIIDCAGAKVGIACLNSAWRSSGTKDKGQLFLTSKQVNEAADAIEGCDIKLAIVHHPISWLHESEQSIIVADLKSRFNLLIGGHIHENVTLYELSPGGRAVILTAPAIFSPGKPEGYNYYIIDPINKTLTCHFRKFIRARREYDKNVDHAKDGTFQVSLQISILQHAVVLVQKITKAVGELQQRLKRQLQLFQTGDNPVLVSPKIQRLIWNGGVRNISSFKFSVREIIAQSAFVFGQHESGKTIFIETLVTQINEQIEDALPDTIAYFIDYTDYAKKATTAEIWESCLKDWVVQNRPGAGRSAVVAIDNLPDKRADFVEATVRVLDAEKIRFVITISNTFFLDTLAASKGAAGYSFFQVSEWGPSRIREFTKKVFGDTEIDPEAAYLFVRRSLEDTDLPANPVTVSLYLSVFPRLGKHLTSLSFLNLLEQLEAIRLESGDAHTYSAYNKKEILMQLAIKCCETGEIALPRRDVEQMIEKFFKDRLLDVDVGKFLTVLERTQMVFVSEAEVGFPYYVFFDYYLAKAFSKNPDELEKRVVTLRDFVTYNNAVAFLGGLSREDTKMLSRLLERMIAFFPAFPRFTLRDLDRYINEICDAEDIDVPVDEVATKHLTATKDAERDDPQFERNKENYRKNRKALEKIIRAETDMGRLQMEMGALKTFYNLFRNLENITGEHKTRFLDTVLDFHIKCNLDIIEFFQKVFKNKRISAIGAYLVTIHGQYFLAANIGNQTLRGTIEACEKSTDNDLKRLLLVQLYSDLRLPNYIERMEGCLKETKSIAAIELIYYSTKCLMIDYEGEVIPARLIALFKKTFERRQEYYKIGRAKEGYKRELQEVMKTRSDFLWRSDSINLE